VIPSGLITALATPFGADGSLDLSAWQMLLAGQLKAGVDAVVVAGSTGEAAALDDDEYVTLIRTAVTVLGDAMPVIAGTGLSATAQTIARTRLAASAGATHALVVTPPYVRPTQAGLVAHYRAVAAEGGLPVILYNVPGRTGCDLLPETVLELATLPGIVGFKEAVNDPVRLRALQPLGARAGFALLSGDDGTACLAMQAGFNGLVSVGSNVLPASYALMCHLALRGEVEAAQSWDARLAPYHAFCGVEPNPIPVKALLRRRGLGQGLRLPLCELSAAHHAQADVLAAGVPVLEELSGRM
jgi:4-hydroxy-tetrahydrodipicolinate synthase